MLGWFGLIFFGLGSWILFSQKKMGNGVLCLILASISLVFIIRGANYPGYTNARQALTFAEKHESGVVVLDMVDDQYGNGPTDGNAVYLLKNTKKKGYVFKHNDKYFYLLERITYITDVGDPYSSYRYQVDAIPVDQKGSIPAKYLNIDSDAYTEGHSSESLGDSYHDATKYLNN